MRRTLAVAASPSRSRRWRELKSLTVTTPAASANFVRRSSSSTAWWKMSFACAVSVNGTPANRFERLPEGGERLRRPVHGGPEVGGPSALGRQVMNGRADAGDAVLEVG